MSEDFSVEIKDEESGQTKIAHLKGELDEMSLEPLKQKIDPILDDRKVTRFILDFTDLEFINSKGIGYLVSVHSHLTKDARSLVIANANEPVMDVISLVGLTSIIPYFSTIEEALKGNKA